MTTQTHGNRPLAHSLSKSLSPAAALRGQASGGASVGPRSADAPLVVGETFSGYRIDRLLGAGGQGVVYAATEVDSGDCVALKVPHPEMASGFSREARNAARLDHPAFVRVRHVSEGDRPYLAMDLMPRGSLRDLLQKHPGGLRLARVQSIATEILEALAYAHGRGVVHRDVKPENILFDADWTARLSDLGLGVRSVPGPLLSASVAYSVEGAAELAGTLRYMAPEQENSSLLGDEPLDGRADLFAFGKVLYEMLTGHSASTIRQPSRVRDGLDPVWDELVYRLTEERRDGRYPDAGRALVALRAACASVPIGEWLGQPAALWQEEATSQTAGDAPFVRKLVLGSVTAILFGSAFISLALSQFMVLPAYAEPQLLGLVCVVWAWGCTWSILGKALRKRSPRRRAHAPV